MLDWTDRHCRSLHRMLTRRTRLYTEMVTTGALLHGDVPRHLDFSAEEHPVALQLGGSDPSELAEAARLGARWGYDEINLNCGCPSERVQRGSFGACLMAEPSLVADCVKAMCDAVDLPVTVKHRIGIDRIEDYGFMRDFVGAVSEAGCEVFIVHARNAWLKGLSPKENREVPPLRYELVYRLKQEFPRLTVVLNGGITDWNAVHTHLAHVDGVMVGREAYHNPWWLAIADSALWGETNPVSQRAEVVPLLIGYADRMRREGVPLKTVARHALGLFHGTPGGKAWRRLLSDPKRLAEEDPALFWEAMPNALKAAADA